MRSTSLSHESASTASQPDVSSRVISQIVSLDGEWLVIATNYGAIFLLDSDTHQVIKKLEIPAYIFTKPFDELNLAFTENKKWLIAFNKEKAWIWFLADTPRLYEIAADTANRISGVSNGLYFNIALSHFSDVAVAEDNSYLDFAIHCPNFLETDLSRWTLRVELNPLCQKLKTRIRDELPEGMVMRSSSPLPAIMADLNPALIEYSPREFLNESRVTSLAIHEVALKKLANTQQPVSLEDYLFSSTRSALSKLNFSVVAFSENSHPIRKQADFLFQEELAEDSFFGAYIMAKCELPDGSIPPLAIALIDKDKELLAAAIINFYPERKIKGKIEYIAAYDKGHGVGSLLLGAIANIFTSVGVFVFDLDSVPGARNFYRSFDMQLLSKKMMGEQKDFYSHIPPQCLLERKFRQVSGRQVFSFFKMSEDPSVSMDVSVTGVKGPGQTQEVINEKTKKTYFVESLPEHLQTPGKAQIRLFMTDTSAKFSSVHKSAFAKYYTREEHAARVIKSFFFRRKREKALIAEARAEMLQQRARAADKSLAGRRIKPRSR